MAPVSGLRRFLGVESVLSHLIEQRFAAHVQFFRRLCAIPTCFVKSFHDKRALGSISQRLDVGLKSLRGVELWKRVAAAPRQEFELGNPDGRPSRAQQRALNCVLKFADVPLPVVAAEQLKGLGRNLTHTLSKHGTVFLEKMPDIQMDVFPVSAERRHRDFQNIEAIE